MLSVRTCVQNLPRTAPHPHTPRLIFPTTLGSGCAHFLFIGKTDAQKSAYGQQLVSVRTRCVWGGNAKKHLKSWFNYPKYRRSQIDPSDGQCPEASCTGTTFTFQMLCGHHGFFSISSWAASSPQMQFFQWLITNERPHYLPCSFSPLFPIYYNQEVMFFI